MNDRFSGAEALIEAQGITVARQGGEILSNVDVRVRAGEIVTLIGPNGAGKTTVVRVVLGLLGPNRGTVRRRPGLIVGYMPQRLHIDPTLPLTVGRFLALGAARGGSHVRDRAAAVLAEVGAGTLMETPLEAVSGGEFQRIILARALLRDPDLLVLDEPSQGVDVNGQAELYDLITGIRDRHGLGVLLVSHDLHLVMANTDQVICLNHHVCCAGHPEMVTNDPSYIALFGKQVASTIAVYHHHHDHTHDADGRIIPLSAASGAAGGNATPDPHREG